MEYCEGGDLSTTIKRAVNRNTPIPEDAIWAYFMQILLALNYCHNTEGHEERAHILHRDLKPENGTFCVLMRYWLLTGAPIM
jgi:NIMA (never in mitosis gene a)-related kinase